MTTKNDNNPSVNAKQLIEALEDARRREVRAAQLYRMLGDRESSQRKKEIFYKLAAEEEKHARLFAERIEANGGVPEVITMQKPSARDRMIAAAFGTETMLKRMEAEEERNIAVFERQSKIIDTDPITRTLFEEVEQEEQAHAKLLSGMHHANTPAGRLEAMLHGEKWHVNTGSWIGDAIYGMNDGLTAVFGIVSGMAGLTSAHQDRVGLVIGAGMMATLASALSMGSSAFLAAKAEREVHEAEVDRERVEIEENPEHEIEELALIYQLKGFSEEESRKMAETISKQPDVFLKTMAQEELGLSDKNFPSPWNSLFSGLISTAIGGLLPVSPFFFSHGQTALIISAVISTLAHFGVGAAKTIVTSRPWFASGLEMTAVGVGMGVITYVLGVFFKVG